MASHIDHQMNSYLNEMEQLQAKMTELHKTKEQEKEKQENKLNNIEPNIAVLQEWLDIYNFNKEQKEMANVSKKIYDSYMLNNGRRRLDELSTEENEERAKIIDNYRKYCNKNFNNDGVIINPNNIKPIGTFQSTTHNTRTNRQSYQIIEPSEFMKQYIEATHNLFLIQQKRIEELENVVAELSKEIKKTSD